MNEGSDHRADQKLRYARIHIGELKEYPGATSNDEWENSHQESVFFHLAGAIEGLLHEINIGYSLELELRKVTWNGVERKLPKGSSPAFSCLKQLKDDRARWLWMLFEWRNHGAHRARVGKVVTFSTTKRTDNQFVDPGTGQPPSLFEGMGCLEILEQLEQNVGELVNECRRIDSRLRAFGNVPESTGEAACEV